MFKKIAALSISILILSSAYAEEKADAKKILSRMDDEYNKHKDLELLMTVTLYSDGKEEKVIKAKNQQKGGQKRLLRMLEPGDIAGMAILSEDADTMYVYLPKYERIRRVAAHARKNSFMGSDFTEQEMGILRYDAVFDPELKETTDKEYKLLLKPKPGREFEADHLLMWIDKKTNLFNKVEYYGKEGVKLKTQFRSKPKKVGPGWVQTNVKMVDHQKNHSTVMEFSDIKADQGLPDKLFTRRNLEWGE